MIARLLEVAGNYKPKPFDDPQIIDISLNNTYTDAKGNSTPTVFGYAGGVPIFEQIDGRGALRVNAGQGITWNVIPGKPRLMNTPNWRFEFEIRMVNPLVFKHETIFVLRRAPLSAAYNFFFWKHAQTNNKIIMTGDQWKVETAPMFADTVTMPTNTWRKFAVTHSAVDNTTRFYVNDVLRGSRVSASDVSCDIIEIINGAAPNFFNGWIRDIKFFKAL
jgi:hypothetical protein